jgi:hypothetical protein
MTVYLLVGLTVISVIICYYAAEQRGLSKPYWVFMGAFLGPLAVPFVFLAKSKRTNNNDTH